MSQQVSLSEILDKPGGTKYAFKILLFDGLGMVFDGFDYMIVSFCMPLIMAEMELGYVSSGMLSSWSFVGMLIGGFGAGYLADRFGRRHVLNVSIMMYALLTVPIFFVQSYDAFAVCRVLSGIFIGAVIPMSVTLASEFAPPRYRARFVTTSKCCMMIGWVIAGLVAIFVVPTLGWRFCFLIGGLPFIYGIIMYFLIPESPYWLLRMGKTEKALKIINDINSKLDSPRDKPYTADEIANEPAQPKGQLREVVSKKYLRVTIGIWLVALLGCPLSYGLSNWMPTILVESGYALTEGYALTVTMHVLGCFGALFAGFMADKIGRLNSTYFACVMAIIAVGILGYFGFHQGYMLIPAMFMGFAINYAHITPQPITVEAYPTEIRATAHSCVTTIARIGGVITPVLIGAFLASGVSFENILYLFAVPLALCIVATKVLIRTETKDKTIEQLDA